GISEGNLWYHFRAKRDLVAALSDELGARIEQNLSRPPAGGRDRFCSMRAPSSSESAATRSRLARKWYQRLPSLMPRAAATWPNDTPASPRSLKRARLACKMRSRVFIGAPILFDIWGLQPRFDGLT